MDNIWFTLENITYDKAERRLEGNCTDGVYLGQVAVYLPEEISDKSLVPGITVRVLVGPAMTRSLPPILMGLEELIISE